MAWIDATAVAAALLLVAGCGDDSGTPSGSDTTSGGSSTGPVTTFEPTTTIDPSGAASSSSGGGGSSDTAADETAGSEGSDSGDSTGGDSSSSGEPAGPTVDSTVPQDLDAGVAPDGALSVTFSEAMDPATITTDTDGRCAGTIQLSLDDFSTCVPMTAAPTTEDGLTFVVQPAAALDSRTLYRLRVLSAATSVSGLPLAEDFEHDNGFRVRYFHTIVIDGIDDFELVEVLPSSTVDHTARVAWDDSYIYIGMDSPDLAVDSSDVWLAVYLGDAGGGTEGTSEGVLYNTQAPSMPFEASWHVRSRADGGFDGVMMWTDAEWNDAPFQLGKDEIAAAGSYLEFRVARADLGDPDYLDFHLDLLRETPLDEATWAAVPMGSHVDGYDPDYSQFLQFDLAGSTAPADVLP